MLCYATRSRSTRGGFSNTPETECARRSRHQGPQSNFDDVSDELASVIAAGYSTTGRPERAVEWCRATVVRSPGAHTASRAVMAIALATAGATNEAMEASESLLAAAAGTDNPGMTGAALLAYGWARRESDPNAAYEALRRALVIASKSGERQQTSIISGLLTGLSVSHGQLADALGYITQTIRHYYDSGTIELMRSALGLLTALFDRLGYRESAATISGFAATALARASFPEIDTAITHLREVLGSERYATLARTGAGMTTAEMAAYAFEQIDLARAALT